MSEIISLCYRELSTTPIPDECLTKLNWNISDQLPDIEYKHKHGPGHQQRRIHVTTHNGNETCAFYHFKPIFTPEISTELFASVGLENDSTPERIAQQWIWGTTTSTPHTDFTRLEEYIYIVDPGGHNVVTTWFIEPGQPLIRDRNIELSRMSNTTHLKKVCSTILKPNVWYYFNTSIIHSVENIESMRTSICINWWNQP